MGGCLLALILAVNLLGVNVKDAAALPVLFWIKRPFA